MKKIFILISLLIFSVSIYSKDTIYAIVTDDSIIIRDYNALRNCAAKYVMTAYRNGNEITIYETDTAKKSANCLCNFNMHVTLALLVASNYNVIVKDIDPDTLLIDSTSFVIAKKKSGSDPISIISQYQSVCRGNDNVSVQEIKNENIYLSNYPNPCINKSTISYQLEKESSVSLKLYDYLGNDVATLLDESMSKGNHKFEYDNQFLRSGIYFIRFLTPQTSETIKVLVIRN